MPIREETPGQNKDTLERLYLSDGLGKSWRPPGGVGGSGCGEERLDLPAQTVAPGTWTRLSGRKRNETTRIIICLLLPAWVESAVQPPEGSVRLARSSSRFVSVTTAQGPLCPCASGDSADVAFHT